MKNLLILLAFIPALAFGQVDSVYIDNPIGCMIVVDTRNFCQNHHVDQDDPPPRHRFFPDYITKDEQILRSFLIRMRYTRTCDVCGAMVMQRVVSWSNGRIEWTCENKIILPALERL